MKKVEEKKKAYEEWLHFERYRCVNAEVKWRVNAAKRAANNRWSRFW